MADFYHYIKKWALKALFAHLRLADIELAATRFNRYIKALPLVLSNI